MEACLFRQDAYAVLVMLSHIFRSWDNVWDGDQPVTREILNDVLSDLAFELSHNAFWQQHEAVLQAQIFIAWNAWMDANTWQQDGTTAQRYCAFFIRDYCNELVPLVAWLCGGKAHARTISLKVRERYVAELMEDTHGLIFLDNKNRN